MILPYEKRVMTIIDNTKTFSETERSRKQEL